LSVGAKVEIQGRVQEFPCDEEEGAIDETKSSESDYFFMVGRERETVEDVLE